jgi:hypothetical protein
MLEAPVAQVLEQAGIKTVMLSLDVKQYLAQRWSLPSHTTVNSAASSRP